MQIQLISCISFHICLASYSGRKLYRFLQGLSCFEFITISAFWKISMRFMFEVIKAIFFISWERGLLFQNLYVILFSNTAIQKYRYYHAFHSIFACLFQWEETFEGFKLFWVYNNFRILKNFNEIKVWAYKS